MELVTKTYKGDDVRLYVEESTVSNSQIDGTSISLNVIIPRSPSDVFIYCYIIARYPF